MMVSAPVKLSAGDGTGSFQIRGLLRLWGMPEAGGDNR